MGLRRRSRWLRGALNHWLLFVSGRIDYDVSDRTAPDWGHAVEFAGHKIAGGAVGWSISHIWPEASENASANLCVAGRALYLATAFESTCSYALRLGLIARAAVAHPDKHLGELIDSVPTEPRLHRAISMLVHPPIRDDESRRANVARDFIAHEGPAYCPFKPRDGGIANHIKGLPEEVDHLVAGKNAESTMVYEIQENERAPRHLIEHYPPLVDAWIFGSLELEQL
jgi:hypothetical protein